MYMIKVGLLWATKKCGHIIFRSLVIAIYRLISIVVVETIGRCKPDCHGDVIAHIWKKVSILQNSEIRERESEMKTY